MKILHLHAGPDTGGQSMGGKPILEAAGHEVRVFARPHPFCYPRAETWAGDDAEVNESIDWADVVVAHNEPRTFDIFAKGRRKPLVIHHHGSKFRGPMGSLIYERGEELRAVQVVSTVDLLDRLPGAELYWQPQNIDLPRMAAIRATGYAPGGRVRIVHAPTNRTVKGTRFLERAARDLHNEVELLIVEHRKWEQCLRIKATADIYADQFYLGYGNNAIEAWAMGLPVVAGAEAPILKRMRKEFGALPFLCCDDSSLRGSLLDLARSADMRAEWAARGMAHIQRFHAPGPWLARFEELAEMAIARANAPV